MFSISKQKKTLKTPSPKLLVLILIPFVIRKKFNVFLNFVCGEWGEGGGLDYSPVELQIQAYHCITGDGFLMIGQSVLYWFTETYAEVKHSTQGNFGQIDNCFTNEHQHM